MNSELSLLTLNGARSQGRDDCGEIAVGKKADIVLINTDTVSTIPSYSLDATFAYSVKSSDVYMTMVDGNVLYENGEYKKKSQSVRVRIVDGDEEYDVFQMTLYPVDDLQIYRMRNFDRLLLGEFSYGFVDQNEENISDCVTNKVDLVKYPLVGFAVCSSLDNERGKHYDLVNIDNYLDIQNTIKVNKHTRSRKKF